MAVIQEAYIHGVSTRAVDDLVRAMGLTGTSKSQVSRLCEGEPSRRHAFETDGERRAGAGIPEPAPRRVDPHEFAPPDRIPDSPGDGRRGQRPFLWLDACLT